ncbi:MAG: hypothetical protein K6F27_09025 [Ruminococcus sp.]|nr:hypothetical protein [Ruminococcus sp.]
MPGKYPELTAKSYVIKNGEEIEYSSLSNEEKKKMWNEINSTFCDEMRAYLNQHPEQIKSFRNIPQ